MGTTCVFALLKIHLDDRSVSGINYHQRSYIHQLPALVCQLYYGCGFTLNSVFLYHILVVICRKKEIFNLSKDLIAFW